jgi:tetratricopeptide (TPR) repeat protein
MTVIRIAERSTSADGFEARVEFAAGGSHDIKFQDPSVELLEKNLQWYFEQHLRYPFLDQDLESAAVDYTVAYGLQLFRSVLGGDAQYEYRRLKDSGFDNCSIHISGSTEFHRLHWECLRDPDLGRAALALRLPVTRHVSPACLGFDLRSDLSTLNILIVSARPYGERDVGPRVISRPLLQTLRNSSIPVNVELVRPGTWAALQGKLDAVRLKHGSGWYQIVHFDVHGVFTNGPANDGVSSSEVESILYQPAGAAQGHLLFEGNSGGVAHFVPASEVAELLNEHRVSIAVMNACQSAMQLGSEAALAQRLVEAGVPFALGMAYSVTVSATQIGMPVMYERLASGASPGEALRELRRSLFTNRSRQAYFRQTLSLEDWILPIGFEQRPVRFRLQNMTSDERRAYLLRRADIGEEPTFQFGFVGRDLDIQAIETIVFGAKRGNQLIVHGMSGVGKSALLRHLAWWWRVTGPCRSSFLFSYDHRRWTAKQIAEHIARTLLDNRDFNEFEVLPLAAQYELVATKLRQEGHLVILDNLESVTSPSQSTPHDLTDAEQNSLVDFIAKLRGGKTLLLLGSREREEWLLERGLNIRHYHLSALDAEAASILVGRVMKRHHVTEYLTDAEHREDLKRLVRMLGGLPGAIETVLPWLQESTPAEINESLRANGGGDEGRLLDTMQRAVEFSYEKIDAATRQPLLLCAPFHVILIKQLLPEYVKLLSEEDIDSTISTSMMNDALAAAERVGLLEPHKTIDTGKVIHPILTLFLTRASAASNPKLAMQLRRAHYRLYCQLGKALRADVLSASPDRVATAKHVFQADYANFEAAFQYSVDAGEQLLPLVQSMEELLESIGSLERVRVLLLKCLDVLSHQMVERWGTDLGVVCQLLGINARKRGDLVGANQYLMNALQHAESSNDIKLSGLCYHELGNVLLAQNKPEAASAWFRRALDASADRSRARGNALINLSAVAYEVEDYDTALGYSREALEIFEASGDRQNATLARAAIVAAMRSLGWHQKEFLIEAEQLIRDVMDELDTLRLPEDRAAVLTEFGQILLALNRTDEALQVFRNVLDIAQSRADTRLEAHAHRGIGACLSVGGQRPVETEGRFLKAVDLLGDQTSASALRSLSLSYYRSGRFEDAVRIMTEALRKYEERGSTLQIVQCLYHLGNVERDRGRLPLAATNYRRASELASPISAYKELSLIYTNWSKLLLIEGNIGDALRCEVRAIFFWLNRYPTVDVEDVELLRAIAGEISKADFKRIVCESSPSRAAAEKLLQLVRAGTTG